MAVSRGTPWARGLDRSRVRWANLSRLIGERRQRYPQRLLDVGEARISVCDQVGERGDLLGCCLGSESFTACPGAALGDALNARRAGDLSQGCAEVEVVMDEAVLAGCDERDCVAVAGLGDRVGWPVLDRCAKLLVV